MLLARRTTPARPYRWLPRLALFALAACSDATGAPSTNPLPVLTSASPSLIVVGSAATTVTVKGGGFVRASQVRWNESDRITHYQNESSLTVDLTTADLATMTIGKLTVVNGAPGGGTSGTLSLPVGYPVPQVTSVTPNSTPALSSSSPAFKTTIVGRGFVNQSRVQIGSTYASIVSVTPTQIVASISGYYLQTPGTQQLVVTNPTPGGGPSNSVDVSVNYPTPTIVSLAPDSSLTGAGFTLTVNGTGFGTASMVRWNGADRPTTFVSTTKITAAIPASDVAAPSTPSIAVVNPAPGGGTSNVVTYRVREAAPAISAITPGVITAGTTSATVTINGTNFRTGATAQWNGSDRPSSLVSGTSMTITLSSSDLAAASTGTVTVTNPGASGVSNGMAVTVVPPSPTLSITRTITLANADVVYDSTRGVLYASVPSTASSNPNTVVRIDPVSGAITGTVSVGSNPNVLAITDDGQYLYVGLLGAPVITRVALTTFTRDIDIAMQSDSFFGDTYAEDIVAIPGAPHTIAASTFYTGLSPRNAGTYVYDDGTRRTATGPGHTGSNRIVRGPTAARIYGYNNETTEFGFRSVIVAPDGLHEETVKAGLITGFGVDIAYSGGFVYATTGEVIDVAAMQKVGTIPTTGTVRPDAATGRVHFLSSSTIRTYHYTTFSPIGQFTHALLASHTKLIRWGSDGLAAGGGSTLVLMRGTLAGN